MKKIKILVKNIHNWKKDKHFLWMNFNCDDNNCYIDVIYLFVINLKEKKSFKM